ncbi:MAG: hypothetical protein FWH24_01950, partial [Oscillospiraceae bacterium]|nr:hypothetical protein [Oscillospiraceae bacterium]
MKKVLSMLSAVVIIFMLMPMISFASTEPASVDGRVTFNGNQYQRFDQSMTWKEAKAYAESLGGHLVTINSQAESDFVAELISDGTKNQYWIGAESEGNWGDWKWVTGEPWSYTNWGRGEPNGPGNCAFVQMYRIPNPHTGYYEEDALGKWNDHVNDNSHNEEFFGLENVGFVVEWSGTAAPPEEMPPPPVVPIEPVPPIGILPFTAIAVETGVKLEWQPIAGAIGYRIYRSTTSGVEGITITDFPIAGVFQLDFNVDESTTYSYGLRPLL